MNMSNFDMEIFAADLPERLRESAFSGMVWSKASYWMLMEGNLRERPRSPNIHRWESAQAEVEIAMAYFASFCKQPVDGKAIAEFYTTTGSVRTYPEDEQEKHIQNVAKLKGISVDEARKLVEEQDDAQAKENRALKNKLHDQLDALGNKLEHGIVRADPTEYQLTAKDLETFLVKVIEKGENLKARLDQLILRVRRPELQAAYQGTILEVERKLQEVSTLLLEVMDVSHRETQENASQGREIDETSDRSMH